ncbi:c-type cytochrome [Thioalkalivibrio thiocyanodenitrificans]|uniref:c-type cytochrome n=1 Tax=Thioalkalivibrio thiocyanodenitrificans TaxID=243063 RepID=UPI00037A2E70|nr:c-type cytochrome [Thioalkalivibrio thiocyanodenitrificans]
MKHRLGVLALGAAALFSGGVMAGDPAAGQLKADTCLGCHGIPSYKNVYPTYHVPKIGGQHAEYLVDALRAYQAGQRQHPTMRAQSADMSEQDMLDIAAFFANAPR